MFKRNAIAVWILTLASLGAFAQSSVNGEGGLLTTDSNGNVSGTIPITSLNRKKVNGSFSIRLPQTEIGSLTYGACLFKGGLVVINTGPYKFRGSMTYSSTICPGPAWLGLVGSNGYSYSLVFGVTGEQGTGSCVLLTVPQPERWVDSADVAVISCTIQ